MYLCGGLPKAARALLLATGRADIGMMASPVTKDGLPPRPLRWAADNGCYTERDRFRPERWLRWLDGRAADFDRCLFAVAPDVVGDAERTLARSAPFLEPLAARGLRVAFVTQDGCRSDLVPWDRIGCLFVGGTTAWKLSEPSFALCAEAKERGKWVHMGRVNSFRRLRACKTAGIDSADGTHLTFRPTEYIPELLRWLDALKAQTVMVA